MQSPTHTNTNNLQPPSSQHWLDISHQDIHQRGFYPHSGSWRTSVLVEWIAALPGRGPPSAHTPGPCSSNRTRRRPFHHEAVPHDLHDRIAYSNIRRSNMCCWYWKASELNEDPPFSIRTIRPTAYRWGRRSHLWFQCLSHNYVAIRFIIKS